MDPFTAAIGPLLTAVAGAALAWVLIRGKDAANKAQPAGAPPDSPRERLYRRSFESSPVGLAVLTPQGQWVRVNERMRVLLGYARDEFARINLRELTHSDDRKLEASYIRKLMRREIGSYSLQKRLLCKDRRYRKFEVSMVRFEDGGGTQDLWQCVVSPVTASIPEEVAEQGGKLGRLLEPISDLAYLSYDDQGIIEDWNEGATRVFGYAREEIIGRSRTTLYRDSDVWGEKPLKDLKEAIAHGRLEYDDTRVGSDGLEVRLKITIIPDVRDDRVAGFMELAREIEQARGVDQYRQAYERLKEISEARMHSMQAENVELRREVDQFREKEASQLADLSRARDDSQKQMTELRILTDAFRKELENRKSLERELNEVLEERDQLGHRMIELESRTPMLETEHVDLATPGEAHWISIETGRPAEMLRELARAGRTGSLVAASHSAEKRIFFEHGTIYSSTSNDPSMLLGEVLLREGTISREDHERALEVHHETGIALGRILVLTGTIGEPTLSSALVAKTKNEVLDFLGWTEGQMMFLDGEAGSLQLIPVRIAVGSLVSDDGEPTFDDDIDDTLIQTPPESVEPPAPEAEGESTPEPVDTAPEEEELHDDSVRDEGPGVDGPRFVASRSKRSTKFHRIDCQSARNIDAAKRLEFQTETEALESGLEPCRKCIG